MRAEVFLPWPDKKLSPNGSHGHWAPLAKAKKKAKADAHHLTLAAGIGKIEADTLKAHYIFFPPTRRTYDRDNLIARMKAAQDGIAQAIGIDDGKWTTTYELRGTVEKNGMVKVILDWSQAQEEAAA